MADNVTANAGSGGADFATDDIGGVHYPITKLTFGALDAQTIASSGAGNVDAGTQRVVLASDQAVVSTNWAGTAPPIGAGLEATALRVTLATDSTGLVSVDDGGGSLTIDGTVDLGATDNAVLDDIAAHLTNAISTNNSSTATLGISAAFTGTGDDVSEYAAISVQIDSSHDSASDGMTFQFSTDNTNWDDVYTFTYTAADGSRRFQFPVTAQYFRLVYTNGGTGQTHFRVQTILHRQPIATSIHRIVDDVNPDRSAEIVKSALIAQVNGTGDFTPIQANAAGVLKIGGSVDLDAGSNLVGDVGISGARTSGGTTPYRNIDVDETEDEIKGTAGQIYWLHAMNLTAAVLYLQIYNATAASVTVGTTTADLTFPLPTQADTNGAGFTLAIPNGIAMGTAITIAATTTIGGSAGPAANGCVVNLGYA